MADIADVRNAIVAIITETLYPNGISGAAVVSGGPVNVLPGYPKASDLTAIKPVLGGGNGGAVISVVDFGTPRSTTRFTPKTVVGAIPAAPLAWSISGNTATISGMISTPQNLCIAAGSPNIDYLHAVAPTDTLVGIAAAFAAMIPGATASGATVTAANLHAARVGVVVPTTKEVGRQVSTIRVGVYASTDAIRSSIVSAIKPVLDDKIRIALPDASVAWMRAGTEMSVWAISKLGLAESAIIYQVEFPTVLLGSAAQAIAWIVNVTADNGPVVTHQG
jgi:hypothetical protein